MRGLAGSSRDGTEPHHFRSGSGIKDTRRSGGGMPRTMAKLGSDLLQDTELQMIVHTIDEVLEVGAGTFSGGVALR